MLTVIKFSALTVIPIYIIMLTLNIYNVKIHFSDSKTVKLKTECEWMLAGSILHYDLSWFLSQAGELCGPITLLTPLFSRVRTRLC